MNRYTYDEYGEIDGEIIAGVWYSIEEIEESDAAQDERDNSSCYSPEIWY